MPDGDANADSERMQILLRRFEIPLLQFATRITGDRERARDVVNVCRKERRMHYLDEELIEAREAEQPMPFERLERQEAAGFLLRIVATLPPRQQEVIQLKFQNDLSYQQIAEITKTTANNVGVLIHTALKTLRQNMRKLLRILFHSHLNDLTRHELR